MLHIPSKTEQWSFQIGSLIRAVNTKAKKLHSFGNDSACNALIGFFQVFIRKASEVVTRMNNWTAKVNTILTRQDEHKLEDIDAMIQVAAGMFDNLNPLFCWLPYTVCVYCRVPVFALSECCDQDLNRTRQNIRSRVAGHAIK